MTRSRKRKLQAQALQPGAKRMRVIPLTFAIAATMHAAQVRAQAQERSGAVELESVIVTAQKRSEDLQDVPVSIQALGSETLEQLHVSDFEDYVKFFPAVSFQTFGPGFAQVYMRGVASGGDGNHSGSLPSVGVYLDEQPITTIQGALDVHLYDIERVEALAGPQGTLYGASSQAGTLRIITNKPDAEEYSASYNLEGNTVADGDTGYLAEGHINIPLSSRAAIRLVGWTRHDAGYLDNVESQRVFPSSGIVTGNFDRGEENYNDVDTTGARAALKFDLNDSWTITPVVMGQEQKANGTFGYDPNIGELEVAHGFPEESKDRWWQAALTVEGRISNLDLTYAGSYLERNVDVEQDYSDYSYWYDVAYYQSGYAFSSYFYDDDGAAIDHSQFINGKDRYKRFTHEVRLSSPQDQRLRFVAGAFVQRQTHGIFQRYMINDLASAISVPNWEDTIWLTQQERVDRDRALFGEVSYDLTEKFTVTGGLRYFEAENSLKGFFGFSDAFGSTGVAECFEFEPYRDAPCKNLDKTIEEDDTIHKLNLTYRIDDDRMIYATWSRGYRPGGINRRGSLPPYLSDFLTNYELGWKTSWAANRLRFNGAVFSQEWEDFQFSLLGQNGLTEIKNANQARINGIEMDAMFAVTNNFTLSAGAAWFDAELTENYCGFTDESGNPVSACVDPEAPEGTELPVTPKFKGNITARYEFPVGSFDAHLQAAVAYVGERWADLRILEREIVGELDAYTIADFAAGIDTGTYSAELFISNAFDERAELSRFAQCAEATCGSQSYVVTNMPRTIGVRFGQRF